MVKSFNQGVTQSHAVAGADLQSVPGSEANSVIGTDFKSAPAMGLPSHSHAVMPSYHFSPCSSLFLNYLASANLKSTR
jgi:hypothetical protein